MLSRRTFLGGAAACALAARPDDRVKLREFAYPQVKLTDGPLAAMHRRILAHFLTLD